MSQEKTKPERLAQKEGLTPAPQPLEVGAAVRELAAKLDNQNETDEAKELALFELRRALNPRNSKWADEMLVRHDGSEHDAQAWARIDLVRNNVELQALKDLFQEALCVPRGQGELFSHALALAFRLGESAGQ